MSGVRPPGVIGGASLVVEGLRLLLRERRLWPLAAAPVALATVLVVLAIGVILGEGGVVHEALTGWIPVLVADRWWQWLWVGPLRLLFALLGWTLFLLATAAAALLAFLVANVAAAPLLDRLSRRVEALETGSVLEDPRPGAAAAVAGGLAAVRAEVRRLTFFVALWLPLVALGLLVPGGQLLSAPGLLALTVLFLPLDYTAYVLDRRLVPFAARRRWLRENLATALGFGAAAFATLVVPGLNFLMLPALVTAGTLLAVRHGPPAAIPPGAPGHPRATKSSARPAS